MSFTISIFLFLYYAFLAVWAIFSLIGIYHVLRFGFKTFVTFFVTFAYLAVSVIILFISFNLINQVDWTLEASTGDLFNTNVRFLNQ